VSLFGVIPFPPTLQKKRENIIATAIAISIKNVIWLDISLSLKYNLMRALTNLLFSTAKLQKLNKISKADDLPVVGQFEILISGRYLLLLTKDNL
jgi:hypothetical protein